MRRLRVLVLMHAPNVPPDDVTGYTDKQLDVFKMEHHVITGLRALGHEVHGLGVGDELRPIRQVLDGWKPHVTMNLLSHFHGVGLHAAYVPSYLELLRVPYTGCKPRGFLLATDKALAKKILHWHRIRVPGFAVFPRERSVRLPRRLRFPLFVKSVAENASWMIAQASVVHDAQSLRERVELVHRQTGTDAIAEEYIEGRELTVSVLGNDRLTVFPAWEMTFANLPERAEPIATSRVKWDPDYQQKIGLETGPARELPAAAAGTIPRLARRVYRALGLCGYARIDLRLAADGSVFVIEANPNPDLCRDEDFAASAATHGLDYTALLHRLLLLGLRASGEVA